MEFAISRPKTVRLPWNEKQIYLWNLGLKCDHRVRPWPWASPWIFKVKYRICYISAKNGRIATKRKANISIELQGLKYEHQGWPWPWPWPWIFKVKYGISYISAKSGPIATKRKANISIEHQASNVTNGFDLDHNLDLGILKVKRDLDRWPHTSPWPWSFMVKFWNSCISEWEGRLTLHKGGGSRSFMTMTKTIWWPRLGVLIYQIVTDFSCRRAFDSSSFSRLSVKFQGHTGQKFANCDPNWMFPDCNPSLNSPMAMKWCTKLEVA